MKDIPKISIITPSLNQGDYLEACIKSVIEQDYPNLEFIVIDGGSSDQSTDIIKKYEGHLSYWQSSPDRGQTDAINKGFLRASGDIINWLNSDDLLEKDALHTVAASFADFPTASCIYGQILEIQNEQILPFSHFPSDKLPQRYYYEFPYAQPAFFFKRSCLEKTGLLDERFSFTMDLDLYYRLAGHFDFVQIDAILARFRWHDASKSSRLGELAESEKRFAFYSLLSSIGFGEGIKLLNELGLGAEQPKSYALAKEDARIHRFQILYEYLLPHLNSYYLRHQYDKIRHVLYFFDRYAPEWMSDPRISNKRKMLRLPDIVLRPVNKIRNFAHRLYYA